MRPISDECNRQIKKCLEDCLSVRKVASLTKVSIGRVQKTRSSMSSLGNFNKRGRPSKLSARQKQYIVRSITKDGNDNAVQVKEALKNDLGIDISERTVRRQLRAAGLVLFVKPKKAMLSERNRKKRLEWAIDHKDWTLDDWKRVIWTDETKVNRFGSDGQAYAWKRSEENLQKRHVKQTLKYGGGNIMVWSCITWEGVGFIVDVGKNMNKEIYLDTLKEDLNNTMDEYGMDKSKLIFMQDNDPKHKSALVMDWLSKQPFKCMEWPPQSPDLNPIENMWALLERRLFKNYETFPAGINDLWERIADTWYDITKEECQKYIETMPDRVKEVLKAKGSWTKY